VISAARVKQSGRVVIMVEIAGAKTWGAVLVVFIADDRAHLMIANAIG